MSRFAIQPRNYDRQINIEVKRITRNGLGEEIVTWDILVANLWANVQPLRGKEFFAGGQLQSTVDHRVEINYRAGLTRDQHRLILDNGQPLDIVNLAELGYHEALEIMAISGVRNGR